VAATDIIARLAGCRYPLGTNLIEGINNTIKVIKRMAYASATTTTLP
jgi:transposase